MHSVAYEHYIHSPEWHELRMIAVTRQPWCSVCDRRAHLDCHHLTYDRLGHERLRDLAVLCHEHHMHLHEQLRLKGQPVAVDTCLPILRAMRKRANRARRPWFLRFF